MNTPDALPVSRDYYNQDVCFIIIFAALMALVLFRADVLYGAVGLIAFYPGAGLASVLIALAGGIGLLAAWRVIRAKTGLIAAALLIFGGLISGAAAQGLAFIGWYTGQFATSISPLALPIMAAVMVAIWLYVRWFKVRLRRLPLKFSTLLVMTITPLLLVGIGTHAARREVVISQWFDDDLYILTLTDLWFVRGAPEWMYLYECNEYGLVCEDIYEATLHYPVLSSPEKVELRLDEEDQVAIFVDNKHLWTYEEDEEEEHE